MLTHKTLKCQILDGTPVEVTVKALPLSKMEDFLTCQGDACAVIRLTTDADPDTLHPESALDIVDAADELNDPLAARLLKRGQALVERYSTKASPTRSLTSLPTSSPTVAPQAGTKPAP